MIYSLGGLFLFFAVLGILIILFLYEFEPPLPYVIGLFSGCLVSSIRIVLMDVSINKSIDMQENKAKNYSQLQFFLRYFITIGYAVLLVVLHKYLGVFGGVIGLLCMQLSAYIANYIINKKISHPRL